MESLHPADTDVNYNGAVEASCDLTNDVNYNPDDQRTEESPPVLPDPVRVTASQEAGDEEEQVVRHDFGVLRTRVSISGSYLARLPIIQHRRA